LNTQVIPSGYPGLIDHLLRVRYFLLILPLQRDFIIQPTRGNGTSSTSPKHIQKNLFAKWDPSAALNNSRVEALSPPNVLFINKTVTEAPGKITTRFGGQKELW